MYLYYTIPTKPDAYNMGLWDCLVKIFTSTKCLFHVGYWLYANSYIGYLFHRLDACINYSSTIQTYILIYINIILYFIQFYFNILFIFLLLLFAFIIFYLVWLNTMMKGSTNSFLIFHIFCIVTPF